jgi:hypothetical protein
MKTLNTIFYVYSEASVAVMMMIGAVLELLCSFAIDIEVLKHLTLVASASFATVSVSLAVSVYRDAKRSGFIS